MRKRKVDTKDKTVKVTTRAINRQVQRTDISRQSENEDMFTSTGLDNVVLATPYSMQLLSNIYEQSNMLKPCIASYITNIVGFGYRVVPINAETEMDNGERDMLQSFISSPNTEESLVSVSSKKIEDYEKYGFSFIEVIRDARKRPSLLRHAKAFGIRLMQKSGEEVPVTTEVMRGGIRRKVTEFKKFRKYVQVVGTKKVYFKEFGDPRVMDYKTGEYQKSGEKIPQENIATELLHHRQFSEDSYGVPRWISQLPSILGSREAEEVNLRYFEDNTVPPMILSVAGGRLTRQSFQDLNNLLSGKGVGRDRQNQILLIEAIAETTGLEDNGSVQLRIDKLTDSRPSDALFKDYDESNMAKVRSSFRIPSILLGLSENVNFSTANTAAYLAESQVFALERTIHDEFLNKRFVNHPNGLGLNTVKLESRGPTLTNPEQVIKTLTAGNVMGGVTPRTSIAVINETMQLSLPQYPEKGEDGYELWMDEPIALSLKKTISGSQQQTGEGDSDRDGESVKPSEVKGTEEEGDVSSQSLAVEHGNE